MKFKDIKGFTVVGSWECSYSLDEFVRAMESWIKEDDLQMNPDFQRGHVWNESQQIAYLEFLLKGGRNSNVIYLNNPNWQKTQSTTYTDFVCVDGLQRATAIKSFIKNEIKVFGHYFKEYEDSPRVTQKIKVNINELDTKEQVLQWYYDLNTGGVVHTEEELNRVLKMIEEEKKLSYK